MIAGLRICVNIGPKHPIREVCQSVKFERRPDAHALATILTLFLPVFALAGPAGFKTGPIIEGFGPVAAITDAQALLKDAHFKIAFDTAKGADGDALNATLQSAARFKALWLRVGPTPA